MSGDITKSRDRGDARKAMVARAQLRYKRAEGAAPRSAAHTGSDTARATMWRKAFHAALCWLALSGIPAVKGKTVIKKIVTKNVNADSAPRLYRNAPHSVYAPYAAYSFHLPAFIAAPKPAASRVIPVKEQLILHNVNGYLRDSYGNKFVETPQSAAYKIAFPVPSVQNQQFVPLQELPAHLSQPLLAAPQNKQPAPNYFFGAPYRIQVAPETSTNGFGGFSQPFVISQNFGGIAPSQAAPTHAQTSPSHTQAITVQHQPSSNQAVYANSQSEESYETPQNEVKFQRLERRPEAHHVHHHSSGAEKSHNDKAQIQAAPIKTHLTAVVNGKKTTVTLETKPPVPLLDLSLLEPLKFDNPLVPQMQHYLPKVNEATYHKLSDFKLNEPKQHKKEVVTHKTKHRNEAPKKKPKQSSVLSDNHKPRPTKPSITVKGTPNKSPEFTYEINSPNYKESYKEQSISYNKATDSDPVNYTYEKKTESEPVIYTYQKTDQKEPVHYHFVQTSNDPVQFKQIDYQPQVQGQGPKQLIYTFKSEEQPKEHRHIQSNDAAEDARSAEVSGNGGPGPVNNQNYYNNQVQHKELLRPIYNYEYYPVFQNPISYHQNPGVRYHKSNNVIISHRSNGNLQLVPDKDAPHGEHRETPQHKSQQGEVPVQMKEAEYHYPQEYEENIRMLSSDAPKDDFSKQIDSYQNPHHAPLKTLDQYKKFVEEQTRRESTPNGPHSSSEPVVLEKTQRIIVQEETPEEMHTHDEQVKAEMVDHEDNNEEDFEKAYKNAAFGFAAFDKQAEDNEKDIYNPINYGFSQEHANFDVEKTPFQEYQAEGDSFPKSSRANYKNARDNIKEDYYLDYSINKPESLADRYQNKANYFKLYKSHKPEKYFGEDKNKNKKSEKYTVAPFEFGPAPEKKQNYFAQNKAQPVQYEYNYEKEAPRDSSAHATHPYQRSKSKTNFVEPQFQYGFEPIGLPRLLDSELAAMASNDSPESEKPGTRKKIYEENFYIKKTSTSGNEPS